jgi:acetyl esterase/lipase
LAKRFIKKLFYTLKHDVDTGKQIVKGRKTSAPVAPRTGVSKIVIPRRHNIKVESSNSDLDNSGGFNAEWIDYHRNKKGEAGERVVLYIHGGAYFFGSRRSHRAITWRLSKYAHARVLAIDYRLAPEHTFPAPIVDVISAYLFLIDPPESRFHRYEPSQISFVGDSAGGCLVIACALYCRDNGIPMPGCLAPISPYLDISQSLPAWYLNKDFDILPDAALDPKYIHEKRSNVYVSHDDDLQHPYVSPILATETDIALPPTLIQAGDGERVRDDGIYFAQKRFPSSPIRVELYSDQPHVFQLFAPVNRFSRFALKRMGQFLFEQTGTSEWRPHIQHETLRIRNIHGHPIEPIHDAFGIIEDGINRLVDHGIWTSYEENGITHVTSPKFLKQKAIVENQ